MNKTKRAFKSILKTVKQDKKEVSYYQNLETIYNSNNELLKKLLQEGEA